MIPHSSRVDNGSDHRAGTIDHPIQNHAQVRLRVHHIVIPPLSAFRESLAINVVDICVVKDR
jgi:hypothetical protein